MSRSSSRHYHGRPTTFLIAGLLMVSMISAFLMIKKAGFLSHEAAATGDEMSLFPGFTVAEQGAPEGRLVITSLRTGSDAENRGASVGDRILAINLHPVKNVRDATRILKDDQSKSIIIRVDHDHVPHDIIVRDK